MLKFMKSPDLFFGIADSLKSVLSNLERPPKTFILRLRHVPIIDASGMHALREFYFKCSKDGTQLLLSGVNKRVLEKLRTFGVVKLIREDCIFPDIDSALRYATSV